MADEDRRYSQIYERELLAMSAEHRRIDLLTITWASNMQKLLLSKTNDLLSTPSKTTHTKKSTTTSKSSSSRNSPKITSSYVPVVFISARVHPGENPSPYAMEAVIDYLLSPQGKHLRRV